MQVFCKDSNLRAVIDTLSLKDSDSSSASAGLLRNLKSRFNTTFRIETGSSMLQDVLSYEEDRFFYPHQSDLRPEDRTKLDGLSRKLLLEFLERRYHLSRSGITQLQNVSVWPLSKAQCRGIWYRNAADSKNSNSHRDSHVLVKAGDGRRPIPLSIRSMFAYEHTFSDDGRPTLEVLLLVRAYRSLPAKDQEYDSWIRYPISGGQLYSPNLEKETKLIHVQDVVSHFAKTPFDPNEIPGIQSKCIHVLPLFWVSIIV